jgi:hypothetical protein
LPRRCTAAGRTRRAPVSLQLELLEDRTVPSVNLGTTFAGLNFNNTTAGEPPDPIAAAGPNHVVDLVNTAIRIYSKTGTILSTQQLPTFFAPLSPGSDNFTDPSVMFDDSVANATGPSGRFIVGVLEFNDSLTSSFFDVAISNDADPTHGFKEMHKIDMTEGQGMSADFPRAGFNADAYVFSFNMFNSFGSFDHVETLTLNKSTVIDASKATFTSYQVNVLSQTVNFNDFTLAPATMHGSTPGGPMYLVDEGASFGVIDVVKMTNVLSNSPTFTETAINVTSYSEPPLAAQPGGTIETNDSRILNAAWRGDRLVADQTVGVGGVAQARWYEFNTHGGGTPTLTQSGNVAGDTGQGSNVSTYYPAIEIAANGNLGMTFMESSNSQFMSMYVTGQTPNDPAGQMETVKRVVAGQVTYSGTRAGDFSGITVDPATGTSFWAASEYIPSSAFWATYVANFSLPGQPEFALSSSANTVTAGKALTFTVTADDANGNPDPTYSGTVTLSSTDPKAVFTDATTGQTGTSFTFSGSSHQFTVTSTKAQAETITATDNNHSPHLTGSLTVTVAPASPSQLVFGQQPTNTVQGFAIRPAVTVKVLDPYGNLETGDKTDQVTLGIASGPGTFASGSTTKLTVTGGVATFSNLILNTSGTYTLSESATNGLSGAASNAFLVAASAVIEGFETTAPNTYLSTHYHVVGAATPTAALSTAAAHNGTYGLVDSNGNDWIYRNDTAAQVKQGDTISVWVNLSNTADGRGYFGFGASSSGTYSLVVAPNTAQLILQLNSNFGFSELAAVSQGYRANHWYRLEVAWSTNGTITGRLFDSNGTTLLNTVTATSTAITSGGIAFRAIGHDKFWDTVSVAHGVNAASTKTRSGLNQPAHPNGFGFNNGNSGRGRGAKAGSAALMAAAFGNGAATPAVPGPASGFLPPAPGSSAQVDFATLFPGATPSHDLSAGHVSGRTGGSGNAREMALLEWFGSQALAKDLTLK